MKKFVFAMAMTLALGFAFSGAALAGFPEKPIQILVGFKAGGGVDTMSRILAEVMSKDLGKPVIVINKAGGGGNLACTALSREKADGYAIGISPSSPMVFNALKGKGRKWSVDSFCYLGTGARFQDSFVAKSDAPFGDFLSMLDYAKKNNKKLRFSSVTPTDAAIASAVSKQTGVALLPVPTKGAAASMAAILGGHVDFGFSAGPHTVYVKTGKMKFVACLQSKRPEEFPNAKTLKEMGFNYVLESNLVVMAPKGLPAEVAARLEKSIKLAFTSDKFKQVVGKLNLVPVYADAAASEKIMADATGDMKHILESK